MSITNKGKVQYKETRRIIRQAKTEDQLVLFVGAGASVNSGMPLWSTAVEKIAEKLSISKNDSLYDVLRIPQYYYNARGKKEYTQLMREIFRYTDNLSTTDLHKRIIEFQSSVIITTNYDHLIEKAAEENGEFLQVISQDIDLPYRKAGRELIKMHGDFEHDNFVLKEDDYLHYSSNFKLIETYVKSLIGSKVVLFIGYSLNDPDVKQIFAWVESALKQDFQRAYLILTKKEKNEIEQEYFRNRGVNIIYSSELIEKATEKSHMEQLVEVLDYILSDEKEKLLDSLYEDLKPFVALNYVYGKYIRTTLRKCGISCDKDMIDLSSDGKIEKEEQQELKQLLWSYLRTGEAPRDYEIDGVDLDKLSVIKTVLCKSSFNTVQMFENTKCLTVDIIDTGVNQLHDLIYKFDYEKMHDLKERNILHLSPDQPELYVQQAYICAYLNEYYNAYNCLKNAAKIYYQNNNYVWYFIAEFNRKYVGKICQSPYIAYGLTKEEKEKLSREIEAIDLERIINSMPDLGNDKNLFLKEIENFNITYTLFYDAFSDSVKVREQASTTYFIFAGATAYERLRERIKDYEKYETCNYLILDRYIENRSIFILYLRSILSSVMAKDLPDLSSTDSASSVGNVHLDKLSSFDYYIMLRHMAQSELKNVFKEYNIKILPSDKEELHYLEEIADSIISASKHIQNFTAASDIFWKYLEILLHVDISTKLAVKILSQIALLKNEFDLRTNNDSISQFIFNLCKEKYYESQKICNLAHRVLNNILDVIAADRKSLSSQFIVTVNNLAYLCLKCGKAYNDSEKIEKISNEDHIGFLIRIYRNLGDEAQSTIKKILSEIIFEENAKGYSNYCLAVRSDIIESNRDVERQLYKWLIKELEKDSSYERNGISFSGSVGYKHVIKELVNLFLNNQIIDTETLAKIVNKTSDEMSIWLLDVEHYDYSKFDCNWLSLCHYGLLKAISANAIAKEGILESYQLQYTTKPLQGNINDIIVKYFIYPNSERKY